jgi:hypothetical protein
MSFPWWEFACYNEYWDELLRKYACNVFCILSRNVRCDLRNAISICFLQKLFETIRSRDHVWSSHRHSWLFNLTFKWVTHAHSRSSSDVCSFSICRATHLMRRLRSCLIKLRAIHQTWRRYLIKLDDVLSNSMISYQTRWRLCLFSLINISEWQTRM